MKRASFIGLAGLLLAGVVHAAIDTYEFADEAQRERFGLLTKELRCPKCQNQDIADSNSPIAADLRKQIHEQLQQGTIGHVAIYPRTIFRRAVELDAAANDGATSGPRCISTAASRVAVWVIPTDEELMIARHTQALLGTPVQTPSPG